ncbi:MAG: hypothetical protein U0R50_14775 [Gaiellales bacterium]
MTAGGLAAPWGRLGEARGAWRHDPDARIANLEGIRDRLTSCIGCGCLSLRACRLFNPGDESAASGAGARLLHRERE